MRISSFYALQLSMHTIVFSVVQSVMIPGHVISVRAVERLEHFINGMLV